MQTRIYVVSYVGAEGAKQRLVEAGSGAQAVRHCVKDVYSAKVANAKDVAAAMGAGQAIEKANVEKGE